MTIYPWKRFWCPRDGAYAVGSDGYLYDPDGRHGLEMNSALAPLSSWSAHRCLVLLGEPGMGKSTEFETEFERAQQQCWDTGDLALRFDLKEYQTDTRLVTDVFENHVVRGWEIGEQTLHLFLDSLDEGRLEIHNIASILSGQLRRLAACQERLRLRIACRTAEWPETLGQALELYWGEGEVCQIELAPLRRRDIAAAAETESLCAATFLNEIQEREIQALAGNPVTLRFLLDSYRKAGRVPGTRSELYEAGCLMLCTESSASRCDSGHLGHLTAAQRLEIASRIAAVSVFSGQSKIYIGNSPLNSTGLTLAELSGGTEYVNQDKFSVSEENLREVLRTPLFSGWGAEHLGFAHRTYAEYLAALYVARRGLDETQVASLIFHPGNRDRVIPQLEETAAWVAITDGRIFQRMLIGDPQALLRSDVTRADDGQKARLIDQLLMGFQSGELDDSDWSLQNHYGKLAHPGLSAQLEPVLRSSTHNRVVRRFAVDLAEACQERRLLDALAALTLNQWEDYHLRCQAAHAILRIGQATDCERLRSLVSADPASDPENELLGCALTGLWSHRLITAEKLFTSLREPEDDSVFGEFFSFLKTQLGKFMRPEDLPCGLRWCSAFPVLRCEGGFLVEAVTEIIRNGVNHLHLPEVLDAFADYTSSRINRHDELGIPVESIQTLDNPLRHALIVATVGRLTDQQPYARGLIYGEPPLISEGDLPWLLEQSELATDEGMKRAWAALAQAQFLSCGSTDRELMIRSRQVNPILRELTAASFEAVELGSEAAVSMQTAYAERLELEQRMQGGRRQPLLSPSPVERIEACLRLCEEGELRGWWQLNRELQLEPSSRAYLHDLQDDLAQLPGWATADERTRDRILTAAKEYLRCWQSHPDDWVGTLILHHPDLAGYRALVLLARYEPTFLASLGVTRWEAIAPVILGFPTSSGLGTDTEETQKHLAGIACQHVPEVVTATLLAMIDRENAIRDRQHLSVLGRIEDCHAPQLTAGLARKATETHLRPTSVRDILECLIARDADQAVRLARNLILRDRPEVRGDRRLLTRVSRPTRFSALVSLPPSPGRSGAGRLRSPARHIPTRRHRRHLAEVAAEVLWLHAPSRGWPILWPRFQENPRFFRSVVTNAAHERRQSRGQADNLSEFEFADLYLLLAREFPHDQDPREWGVHRVGPRESVAHYRDRILRMLQNRGTPAACAALERLAKELPQVKDLPWILRAAQRTTLQTTWTPLPPGQILELAGRTAARVVRSERELQQVVLESLGRLQDRLQGETPAVRDVWDHNPQQKSWMPVDENALSDYITRHLRVDLNHCGIIALREVEVRRGTGDESAGQRTDVYVTAFIQGTHDVVRVVVEVKGCWHQELKTAMETQLRDRYLHDMKCGHGIYLVGWFHCKNWSDSDTRRKKAPKWSLKQAIEFFREQQAKLSGAEILLESCVLNLGLD